MKKLTTSLTLALTLALAAPAVAATPKDGAWSGGSILFTVGGHGKKIESGASNAFLMCGASGTPGFQLQKRVKIKNGKFSYTDTKQYGEFGFKVLFDGKFKSKTSMSGTAQLKATDGSCASDKVPITATYGSM